MQNIIKFKIKAGYYLEFFTPETMILLGGNKSKVTKDKNDENVPILFRNYENSISLFLHC